MADAALAARGVYKPRRPQASPLFRLVSDHLHRLQTVYDERFVREYGSWRPVVGEVADKFLACGVLEHGFARIRCDDCAHEYLLAFSCKGRYFCPSCHAKRLAIWTQWLDTTLLAPVPHRQVVLTIPKRLRAYCLYRRRLLGEIARVATRTVAAAIRTLTGELAVGIVACLQTHGSLANWHPHLHLLVTDGGFRPDGTFVAWPAHDTARLTEAFRRAVLRLFVRLELFDADQAAGMLTWPHSGFHVHDAVWVPEDDRAFARRLARYCARNPVALERLTYDATMKQVTYRSDKSEGPTAGTETVDPLEFLARVLTHIPDKGQVTTRYYGWYANRSRGMRWQAEPVDVGTAVPIVPARPLTPDAAPGAVEPAPQTAHRPLARRQNPEYASVIAIEFPIPGDVYFGMDRYAGALPCYLDSLHLRLELGDRRGEGWMLRRPARVYAAQGLGERARNTAAQAISIAAEVGDEELSEGVPLFH